MCHQFSLLPIHPQSAGLSKHWQDGRQLKEGARMNQRYHADTEVAEVMADTLKDVDSTVITDGSRSIACQTDLTMRDLSDMVANNNSLKVELTIIREENYPQRSQLEK